MSKILRHFIFYFLTISIVISSINNGFTQNRYWVNGTGTWSDSNHWAETTGGNAGASIPTENDNVIFDDNSFTADNQTVLIKESAVCNDFNWNVENVKPILKSKSFLFKSNTKADLQVYGSLIVNENINNEFFGDIVLKSEDKSKVKLGSDLNSNIYFESVKGNWDLISDLKTSGDLEVISGELNLNDNIIDSKSFVSSGNYSRKIDFGESMIITDKIDFSDSRNFEYGSSKINIEIRDKYSDKNFKLGALPVSLAKAGAKAGFGFEEIIINDALCNGDTGSIFVSVSGGATPHSYTYTLYDYTEPPPTATYKLDVTKPDTTHRFSGLVAGDYVIRVEDSGVGLLQDGPYTVDEPDELFAGDITVAQGLLCAGDSDAKLEANPTGGTEPYSYNWYKHNGSDFVSIGQYTKIATGLSTGTYKVWVKDQYNCKDSVSSIEFFTNPPNSTDIPDPIIISSVYVEMPCQGANDGVIQINASGGTGDLDYSIHLVGPPGSYKPDSLFTGLGDDTYGIRVKDENGCIKQDPDVILTELANPTASIIPASPADACPGVALPLDGNPTFYGGATEDTHAWTGTGAASLNDDAIQTPEFTNAVVASYGLIYTVTDNNGCVGTDNLTINVGDTQDPVAVCQDIIVQLDATGNVSIVGTDVDGGSTDNCTAPGDLVFSVLPNSFDCTNIGANAVTLTVTDELLRSDNCVATVTVEDNIAPVAACQDITVQLDATGNVSIIPADIDNGSSDNCSDYTLSLDKTDFTCADIGANTVTLTIDDQHGQTDNCTATVTVEDNIAPTAVCQDITVQLDATGNVSITPADVDNGSGDNCSDFTLSLDVSDFTCADIGANMVTLTINDQHGQTDNCTATVTVEDNLSPTAVCQDITVQLDATGNVSITPADVDNGSGDNCSDFTLSLDITDFTCADIGANIVTLTIDDQHGQTDNCTATVTVEEIEDPVAVCQDITVQLDATGNVSIVGSDVDGGSTDNCTAPGDLVFSVTPNSFDCTDIGANAVTLTVTDEASNSANCAATVTVEDNIAPTAVCQDITVQLDATGNVTITPADVDNGSGDNCSDFTLSLSKTDFTCADIGANLVTLTIDDQHGQTDNCTATVTVEDNIAPTAVCQDITVQLDATGNVSITPADVDNGSGDNCSDFTLSLDITDFTCADIGPNTVTLTIDDQHGQTDNCTATVTVTETEPPVAVCQDITVQLDATGNVNIVGSDVDGGSTDNCTVPGDLVFSVTPNSFDCTNIGANAVTLTVTDEASNSANCAATVTVEDNIAPTAVCQDITVQLDATGNVTITPADVDNGSGDNCSDFTLSLDVSDFTCADIGVNAVTLTIDDQHGQTDNCIANVTVEDNIAPTAVCQDITVQLDGTGNVSIVPADVDNGSGDNCSDYTLSLDVTDFTCADIGPNTVTLTIDDQHGQTDNCTATVTVEETEDPVAVCQDITVQLDGTGNVSIVGSDVDGGSTDNCTAPGDLVFSVTPNSFDCTNIGANAVTLTVTDEASNSANCAATVTVEDNIAPTAVCQDITVQLDATGNVTITPADVDNGSGDNCSDFTLSLDQTAFTCADLGANLVTLTIDDQHGQTDNCTATVTVEDNIVPTITCPVDVYVMQDGGCDVVVNGIAPTTSDNCAVTLQTWEFTGATVATGINDASGETFDIGITTVRYHIEDASGNVAECSFTVEVYDVIDGGLIDADQTVCYNTPPAPFTNEASASVCGDVDYQWQMKSGTDPWTDIPGAIAATYTEFNSLTEITYYNRKATSKLGFGIAYSDTLTMTIQPSPIAYAGKDTTLCYGTPYQILDADTSYTDPAGVSWELLTGNGSFNPVAANTIDPEYIPDPSDGGIVVELVLHADGIGPCGEDTDTVRVTYLPELFVSIGKPTPYLVDSSSTHIDVSVKFKDFDYAAYLGVYLVSPDDSVVELKPYCTTLPPGNFSFNGEYRFYNDPEDTSLISAMNGCSPTDGRYDFSGEWKKKLHGQDPANGAWRVRMINNEPTSGGGSEWLEATIIFMDRNIDLNLEKITYADSSIGKEINPYDGSGPFEITDHTLPITGLTTSCFGVCDARAVATASGGSAPYKKYEWSQFKDFSVIYATGDTVDLCAGTFYVQVTDSHDCTAIDSVLVSEPPEIVITNDTVVHNTCNGYTEGKVMLEFAGGTGALQYSYNGIDYYNSGDTIFNIAAGTHIFTIEDANCTKDTIITINEPDPISISYSITEISCYGIPDGEVDIVVVSGGTAPFEYSITEIPNWTNTTGNFPGLTEDSVYIAVRDANGCIAFDDTVFMANPDTISIDSIKVIPITCSGTGNDGAIIVYASGGVGTLEYSTDNITFQTNDTLKGLPVGDTTVYIRDDCGTKMLDSLVTVTGPIPIVIDSVTVVDVSTCFGDNTGQLIVYAHGGSGNLEYSINGVDYQDSNTFIGLLAGTYSIYAKDKDDICISPEVIETINQPTELIINSFDIINASECNPTLTGIITIHTIGGTKDYWFNIDGGADQRDSTFTDISVGTHTFTVTDDNGCVVSQDTSIIIIDPLTATVDATGVTCNGFANGTVTANPSDGLPPYSYSWDTGETSATIIGKEAGFYSVTITDSNLPTNCEFIGTAEVVEPEVLSVNPDPRNKRCINSPSRNLTNSLGRVIVDVDGGTPSYTYSWTGPSGFTSNNDTIKNLQPGLYSLTVTDGRGCNTTYSTTLVEDNTYDIPSYSVEFEDNSVCWNDSVRFENIFSGNVDTVFFQISEYNGSIWIATNWYAYVNNSPATVGHKIEGKANFDYIRAANEYCYQDTTDILIEYFPSFGLDIIDELDGNAEDDTIYLKGATSGQLAANVTGTADISFVWTPSETLSNPNSQTTVVSPDESGWYQVIATSTDDCVDTSSIYLEFIPAITPNSGFSPNGDGINDYWKIKYINKFQNNIVTVYSRWGVKVFEQKGYNNDDTSRSWDGKAKNGKDLPSGTYYYVIILNEEGFQPITGPITIIR